MASVNWDIKDAQHGFDTLTQMIEKATADANEKICDEILRLSSFEVPHDTGSLQSSGMHEPINDQEREVGYNKVYAARLHEHPEYRFQKGRKGKYLIDPIVKNLDIFRKFQQDAINGVLS